MKTWKKVIELISKQNTLIQEQNKQIEAQNRLLKLYLNSIYGIRKDDFIYVDTDSIKQDGDSISRQDAIAEIYDDFMTIDMVVHDKSAQRCMSILSKLPSVKPQQEDIISRQAVIDVIDNWVKKYGILAVIPTDEVTPLFDSIHKLSPAKPQQEDIAIDGTLTVRVADALKVTRVLVCGDNHFGGLYYPDENAEPQTGHWIDIDGDNAICNCCNRLNLVYGTYCKHCGAKMINPQKGTNDDKEVDTNNNH